MKALYLVRDVNHRADNVWCSWVCAVLEYCYSLQDLWWGQPAGRAALCGYSQCAWVCGTSSEEKMQCEPEGFDSKGWK